MTAASPQPWNQLVEAQTINVIRFVEPLFQSANGYVDEVGNPWTVPLRALWSTETDNSTDGADPPTAPMIPEILVSIEPSSLPYGVGGTRMATDDVTGETIHGWHAAESRIVFDVRGRSDAERHYLIDSLISGVEAGFVVVGQQTVENAIPIQLGAVGLMPRGGFGAPDFLTPEEDGYRPDGQIWPARIAYLVDMWLSWRTAGFSFGTPFNVTTTGIPDQGTAGQVAGGTLSV